MAKILVIGSSNTDMVIKSQRFPQPGETIIGGEFFMFPGGKGANQAVAAARMNSDVTFIAKVGNDVFGQQAVDGFKKENINTNNIFVDPNVASGTAVIIVNGDGENEIVVASGANGTLSAQDIDSSHHCFEENDIVLLQLETPLPTIAHAIAKGSTMGKKVILNPAPAQRLTDDIYSNLYLITPNETEAEILTGIKYESESDLPKIADSLLEKGVKNVIITLGAKGSFFKNNEDSFIVPAQKVEAVDTTAAGDVFNGCLAVVLAEGKSWKEAIEMAGKFASISVTRMGAQASAPYRNEVV
jgi:ribokinase